MDQSPQRNSSGAVDRAAFLRARQRLAALKGFYIHLSVFVLVVAGLLAINFLTGGPWWSLGVLVIWGIGVLGHGFAVKGSRSHALANWEKRKLKQFMAEDRGGQPGS
jgi:hypothetical protein